MSKVISKEDRLKATKEIQQLLLEILPNEDSVKLTINMLNKKTDIEFTQYLEALRDERDCLPLIAPNAVGPQLSVDRNLKIGKKIGHRFFERIWLSDADGNRYLSNDEYLILDLPIRRMAQLISKKISIPEDNNTIDDLTGQPTGKSKGGKVTYPEVQLLQALGLQKTLEEFMKYRGGDELGFRVMNASIENTGGVSIGAIEPYSGGVTSTKTLSTYLTGMHLSNTLV